MQIMKYQYCYLSVISLSIYITFTFLFFIELILIYNTLQFSHVLHILYIGGQRVLQLNSSVKKDYVGSL